MSDPEGIRELAKLHIHMRELPAHVKHPYRAGQTDAEQYRATFRHVQTTLEAAGTRFDRVVTMVVFLTNMENWPMFNEIYREFVPNPPCRAVIGTTGLAEKPLAIEIVECIAYKVAP